MLAGLLRDGLVTQPGHAGYLGAELAEAEAAMRLGLRYQQDKPLRACSPGSEGSSSGGLA
jgi:tetrahydromethanopterin S-methyltransferase subunit A